MKNHVKLNKLPYTLLLPGMSILILTVYIPCILTFFYSLNYYQLTRLTKQKFLGTKNYIEILFSKEFQYALTNTLIVVFVVLFLGIIFSLFIGLILNKKNSISGILTAIAILPWALPPIVNGIIWKFLFLPEIGLINKILYFFNLVSSPIQWLNGRFESLIILGVVVAWRTIPFCALLLLANMQSIPQEIYEASHIDGVSSYNKLRYLTLPLLFPTIIIVILNLILGGINVFDEAVSLFGYRTFSETLMIYNYNQTFAFFNIGYGSAVTYIIMMISGILGFFYINLLKK